MLKSYDFVWGGGKTSRGTENRIRFLRFDVKSCTILGIPGPGGPATPQQETNTSVSDDVIEENESLDVRRWKKHACVLGKQVEVQVHLTRIATLSYITKRWKRGRGTHAAVMVTLDGGPI